MHPENISRDAHGIPGGRQQHALKTFYRLIEKKKRIVLLVFIIYFFLLFIHYNNIL